MRPVGVKAARRGPRCPHARRAGEQAVPPRLRRPQRRVQRWARAVEAVGTPHARAAMTPPLPLLPPGRRAPGVWLCAPCAVQSSHGGWGFEEGEGRDLGDGVAGGVANGTEAHGSAASRAAQQLRQLCSRVVGAGERGGGAAGRLTRQVQGVALARHIAAHVGAQDVAGQDMHKLAGEQRPVVRGRAAAHGRPKPCCLTPPHSRLGYACPHPPLSSSPPQPGAALCCSRNGVSARRSAAESPSCVRPGFACPPLAGTRRREHAMERVLRRRRRRQAQRARARAGGGAGRAKGCCRPPIPGWRVWCTAFWPSAAASSSCRSSDASSTTCWGRMRLRWRGKAVAVGRRPHHHHHRHHRHMRQRVQRPLPPSRGAVATAGRHVARLPPAGTRRARGRRACIGRSWTWRTRGILRN